MDATLVGMVSAGVVGGLIAKVGGPAKEGLRRAMTGRIMLEGDAYRAVSSWLMEFVDDRALRYGDDSFQIGHESDKTVVDGALAPGMRVVKIEGKRLVLDVTREKLDNRIVERLEVVCARRNFIWLRSRLLKVMVEARTEVLKGLPVYHGTCGGWWRFVVRRPFRPVETIEHPDDAPTRILDAIKAWRLTEESVMSRGENFHIGFLLHGPPGTGKTSTAIAVASELKMPLYVLTPRTSSPSPGGLEAPASAGGNSGIEDLLMSLPSNCVLLVEECEQVFGARDGGARDVGTASALSFFDGPLSKRGVVRIYTTNFPERLDTGFRRVGRVDYEFAFPARDGAAPLSSLRREA